MLVRLFLRQVEAPAKLLPNRTLRGFVFRKCGFVQVVPLEFKRMCSGTFAFQSEDLCVLMGNTPRLGPPMSSLHAVICTQLARLSLGLAMLFELDSELSST